MKENDGQESRKLAERRQKLHQVAIDFSSINEPKVLTLPPTGHAIPANVSHASS